MITKETLLDTISSSPIVAAIKDEDGLRSCMESDSKVVFILYGSIITIDEIVRKVKSSGRIALVHIDLIDGLSAKDAAVDYIAEKTEADGIISTKFSMIKAAKSRGMLAVQRFFLLDSLALSTLSKQIVQSNPDLIEVLPGCIPKVITRICHSTKTPVIAGGLIQDKEDIVDALNAGAIGVSATRCEIWSM